MSDLKRAYHSGEIIKIKKDSVDFYALYGTYGLPGIKYPDFGLLSMLNKEITDKIKIKIIK